MMPGMIMLWYGPVATIPSGWALCDGTQGTPDLAGKFVYGAGVPVPPVGATGGTLSHLHAFTGDGHSHNLDIQPYIEDVYPAGYYHHGTDAAPATGDTDLANHVPPYHTLCYIMKLPIP